MNFKTEFTKQCQEKRLVGAVATVVKDNQMIDSAFYGYQSLEDKIPVDIDTVFRIASISKVIVAMTVMTLVEEEKISIEEDIGDILGFPIRNPHHPDIKITVKMLMTQTSSITDGFDDENLENDQETRGYNGVNGTFKNVTLKELLTDKNSPFYTEGTWDKELPGTKFIYSNFGCGILACIVEAVTKEYFTDYVQRRILKPLGLDAGFRATDILKKDKIATLYYRNNQEENPYKVARSKESFLANCYPVFPIRENFRGPAGGLFISMGDLSKLLLVLINDGIYNGVSILRKETLDTMFELHWFGNNDRSYKAKGLQLKFIDDFDGHLFMGHTGSAYGVISMMFFSLEAKIGICFITNGGYYSTGKKRMTDIQEEIMKAFVKSYWPETKKEMEFSFDIEKDYGILDGHRIRISPKPFVSEGKIYLQVKALARGLSVIPEWENGRLILRKNHRMAILDNETADVSKVLENLGIKSTISGTNISVTYPRG